MIEYNSMKCFETFVNDVTDARRRGDADDLQQILSNLAKLIGKKSCLLFSGYIQYKSIPNSMFSFILIKLSIEAILFSAVSH